MKKIIATFLLTVLLGAVAFLALGNNMFMLFFITKNEEAAKIAIAEEVAGYQTWKHYDISFKQRTTDGEDWEEETGYLKLNIGKENETQFVAYSKTEEMVGSTKEVVSESYCYYTEGVLYVHDVKNNAKTQETVAFQDALDDHFYTELLFLENLNLNSSEELSLEVKPNFSFQPFFVGQSLILISSEDDFSASYEFKFDLFRNFRGLTFVMSYEENSVEMGIIVNGINKPVTITLPTDLNTYTV